MKTCRKLFNYTNDIHEAILELGVIIRFPAGWGLRPGLLGFPCRGLGFAGSSPLLVPWLGALGGLGGSACLRSGRFT